MKIGAVTLRDERAEDRFARFARTIMKVQDAPTLPRLWQSMIDGLCEVADADWGAILVPATEDLGDDLYSYNLSPESRDLIAGLLAEVKGGNERLSLSELLAAAGIDCLPPPLRLQSSLALPIREAGRVMGSICIGRNFGFTAEDEVLLRLFAGQAEVVLRKEMAGRKAQDEVRRKEAERLRLNKILSNLPDGIIYAEASSEKIEANRKAAEMLGCSLETLADITLLDGRCCCQNGQPLPLDQLPIKRALRGEYVTGEEHLIARSDGSTLPILCSAAPVFDAEGNVTAAITQFQDMTHVKEAQQRIEELSAERSRLLSAAADQLRRLQVLLDAAPVGIIVVQGTDAQTAVFNQELSRIVGFTPSAEQGLASYSSQVVLRRPDGSVCPIEERPLERALLRGETTRAEEMVLELQDGRTIPVLAHAAPVHGSAGEVTGAVGILEDRSRLIELQQQRADFVAMVGHELRNPLTIIKGAASIVRRRHSTLEMDQLTDLLSGLERQADRLGDLLNNLIDITRLESASFPIIKSPVRLEPLIADACIQFESAGGMNELQVSVEKGLSPVDADGRRVIQVITNLINNAAKFSDIDSPVKVRAEQSQPGWAKITVRDHGLGIAPEDLPRLFQKFSQLHAESREKGSGLGLAICKGIVEAHGGDIWAESDGPGLGASFSFTLPLARP